MMAAVPQLVQCQIVRDRNTKRSKGIAYAEFESTESVTAALTLTGKQLKGAPIVIMPTLAERNRCGPSESRE